MMIVKHLALTTALFVAACRMAPARPEPVRVTPAGCDTCARAVPESVQVARYQQFMKAFQSQFSAFTSSGNYLGLLTTLQKLEADVGPSTMVRQTAAQYEGMFAPMLGEDSLALAYFAIGRRSDPPFDSAALLRARPEPAAGQILRLAAGRRAVFINEAHHMAAHRAFAMGLLEGLYREGFRYLAVETLAESDSNLNTRPYPVRISGVYSNEPVFGELLRRARQLGFRLVPYEAAPRDKDRELSEATNLVSRTFNLDSAARVVVYAGYSHIDESGQLSGMQPMAVRFRALTGIDPLTVDQTVMSDGGVDRLDDPRYLFVTRHLRVSDPVVLRVGDSLWTAKPGIHDLSVVHPPLEYREGRPGWLWKLENRRPVRLGADICGVAPECAVTARAAEESSDAVPIDALRIVRGGTRTLLLPPGRSYVIQAFAGDGSPIGAAVQRNVN